MTRKLLSNRLNDIASLTRLRELSAMEEVARLTGELRRIDHEIDALRARRFDVATPLEAALEGKWQQWRQAEIAALNGRKAKTMAALRGAAGVLGRMTAENEVVDRLRTKTKRREAALRAQRRSYIS